MTQQFEETCRECLEKMEKGYCFRKDPDIENRVSLPCWCDPDTFQSIINAIRKQKLEIL